MLLPLSPTNRTASALYSAENLRRLPLPCFSMTHSYCTFVVLGVSTQPGQVQLNKLYLRLFDARDGSSRAASGWNARHIARPVLL
jgi:hypothetical protein